MSYEILNFFKTDGFILLYGIAFLVSLIKYRQYFDSILKYFPILIGYTFLTETLGYLIRENENFQIIYLDGFSFSNNILYNIFDIILFLYFYFVFFKTSRMSKNRTFIKYGAITFILLSIINPFLQNFILLPQIYALIVGSLVLVMSSIFYLKESNLKLIEISKNRNLLYWVSLGLLSFYTFYPMIMIIGLYYPSYITTFRPLHYLLIILMYLLFIVGFLRMKRMRPTSSEE